MSDLSIEQLASECAEESCQTSALDRGTGSACWELFRRAVIEDIPQAWESLYSQYRHLIGRWATGSSLDLDDLVSETFARFWQGLQGRGFPFPTLRAVLRYLKLCARSLAIDAARRREHQRLVEEALSRQVNTADDPPEEAVLARACWRELCDYILHQLQDENERLVFLLSYEQGLRPAEICAQQPNRFPDAKAVYRLKERIISRLVNDPVLRAWMKEENDAAGRLLR